MTDYSSPNHLLNATIKEFINNNPINSEQRNPEQIHQHWCSYRAQSFARSQQVSQLKFLLLLFCCFQRHSKLRAYHKMSLFCCSEVPLMPWIRKKTAFRKVQMKKLKKLHIQKTIQLTRYLYKIGNGLSEPFYLNTYCIKGRMLFATLFPRK